MVEVIEEKSVFQRTKDLFISLGTGNTIGLAFVLIMGGGFIVTYTMLGQQQDIRQRASETVTTTPTANPLTHQVPIQMTVNLKNAITGTSTATTVSLNSYLANVLYYLPQDTPTGNTISCQQLTGFKGAVTTAMRIDPVAGAQGRSWIAQADAIRAEIPCVAPN